MPTTTVTIEASGSPVTVEIQSGHGHWCLPPGQSLEVKSTDESYAIRKFLILNRYLHLEHRSKHPVSVSIGINSRKSSIALKITLPPTGGSCSVSSEHSLEVTSVPGTTSHTLRLW